ncbi:M20 family metallopeptidase [Aerococcus urinae]|uniref:M20 family metallopeptidase n=1 Tax=Aerococcus urinae TaxID=1376 RepID=UPI0021587FBD|nr:M20 family metallopeptidase [Aerococcus urinae]
MKDEQKITALHDHVRQKVKANFPQILDISQFIFQHPELGDQEYVSSDYLAKLLQEAGFQVDRAYQGIETAFRAEFRLGDGPKIAFLAEYDALPGFGPDKKPGHACGHNWISASTVGAGIVLSQMKEFFQGTVVVIGTPAEENFGRKVDLARSGAFDDIDTCIQMHLYESTNLKASALAMNAVNFHFIGRAAHAAMSPELGINALDAVNLTFTGVSYLRQQLPSDVRIHGIIKEGGQAANVIPESATAFFYVRAPKLATYRQAMDRVINCARGAALMTGCQLEISYPENEFYDLLVNPVLADRMEDHMRLSGFDDISEEEEKPGSTDIGNVSYACPTFYGNVGVGQGKVFVHEEGFLQVADSPEAHQQLKRAVEAFVALAIELDQDPDLLLKVKEAFKAQIKE